MPRVNTRAASPKPPQTKISRHPQGASGVSRRAIQAVAGMPTRPKVAIAAIQRPRLRAGNSSLT